MSLLLFYSRVQKVAQPTDTLLTNDSVNRLQNVTRTRQNTAVVSDSAAIFRIYSRFTTDVLSTSDASQIKQIHYRNFSKLNILTTDSLQFNQIHYRVEADYYPIIDETFDTSNHFRVLTDSTLLSATTATQIITGLGVTEFIYTLDEVQLQYGKPVPIIDLPTLEINDPYEVPAPVNVPRLPLSSYPIAFNIQLGRISLVSNTVPNENFPAALYIFYNKNQAVWYKYKIAAENNYFNQSWSAEFLLYSGTGTINNETNYIGASGVIDSSTIFNVDGYPVTVFENQAGFIGVQYFINGESFVANTANQGTSPNVVISNDTIIAMWIPENYVDSLNFSDSNAAFQKPCSYYVGVPGALQTFSLTQSTDINWVFSFTTQINERNAVYFAST